MIESKIIRCSGSGGLEQCIEMLLNTGWKVVNAFCAPDQPMWCALMIREVDPCD